MVVDAQIPSDCKTHNPSTLRMDCGDCDGGTIAKVCRDSVSAVVLSDITGGDHLLRMKPALIFDRARLGLPKCMVSKRRGRQRRVQRRAQTIHWNSQLQSLKTSRVGNFEIEISSVTWDRLLGVEPRHPRNKHGYGAFVSRDRRCFAFYDIP